MTNIVHQEVKTDVDIILSDRKREFVDNNLTLCENNCEYKGYDFETKKALCECEIKEEINLISDISIDKKKLISLTDIKKLINLDIMKCYKILLIKNGLIKNIGSYILLSTISFFIISVFIFIGKGYKNLCLQIRDIMRQKYLNRFNRFKSS